MINSVSRLLCALSLCILNHCIQALLHITIIFYILHIFPEYICPVSCVVIDIAMIPIAHSNMNKYFVNATSSLTNF